MITSFLNKMNYTKDPTFKSKIRPVNSKEFNQITKTISKSNSINYPWTYNESIKATDTLTKRICDCTGVLITDGKECLMMHLRPDYEKNHISSNIIEVIKSKINLSNNEFNAIIVGSKNTKKSLNLYNTLKSILSNLKIPFSELRNSKKPTDIAYIRDSDSFFITNQTISNNLKKGMTKKESLDKSFEEIKLSNKDTIE